MVKDVLHIKPNVLSKATKFLQGYGPKYPNGKYMTVTQDNTGSSGPHSLQTNAKTADVNNSTKNNTLGESRASKIVEIFQPHMQLPSHRVDSGGLSKNIGGSEFRFHISQHSPDTIGMSFSREKGNTGQFTQSQVQTDDMRTVMQVFQTMSSMLFAYLNSHPGIRHIVFAAVDADSRKRLYARMANRLAQKLGGRAEMKPGGQMWIHM